MKRLLIARHAKSSWDDPGITDHDRPLAPRGRRAVKRLRDHLDGLAHRPDLVLCSSSVRTSETLDGIRPAMGEATVEIEASLYGAAADDLLARLQRVDDRVGCVLLIGHNPGAADLTEMLVAPSGRGDDYPDTFPTAAVASLSFPGRWEGLRPGCASLDSFWRARRPRS
ncbi:MAG: SixA phosphatase family protein [Acidimicrobiales bacterium]